MTSNVPHGWALQLASDVQRDGMSLELVAPDGKAAAEVFRSDAAHTVHIERYVTGIPAGVWEWFISQIASRLVAFEDGSALPPPAAWSGH